MRTTICSMLLTCALMAQGYATAGAPQSSPAASGSETIALFNGKDLSNWYLFLDPEAAGDPRDVWKVTNGTVLCTGESFGYMRTKEKYGDFKLTLEWKWPKKPGNSGVFLWMQDEDKLWPACLEAQLMHERAGDLWAVGGVEFAEVEKGIEDANLTHRGRQNESSEKEPGKWNRYEITCKGGAIELIVNGKLQNKATEATVKEGYIGLQSEGVPIMFRKIELMPLGGK